MALRVSKQFLVISAIVVFAVLVGVGGYIAWRVSRPEELTPEEVEAGEQEDCEAAGHTWCGGGCCPDGWCFGSGCWTGGSCSSRTAEACQGHEGDDDTGDDDCVDSCAICAPVGAVQCIEGHESTCRVVTMCSGEGKWCWMDSGSCSPGDDDDPPPTDCTIRAGCNCCCESYAGCGSGCNFTSTSCPSGHIAMCRDGCNGQCEALHAGHVCANCTDANSCNKSWTCPPGYHPVGSGMMGDPGCDVSVSFQGWCDSCNNPVGCNGCCERDEGDDDSGDDDSGDDDEVTPICGDGILNNVPGQSYPDECELGDPPGVICSWTGENHCDWDTCLCPEIQPEFVQIQGRVFCQEEASGELWPVVGASVQFYKQSRGLSENLATDNDGYFRSLINTTQLSDGAFDVRLTGIPEGSTLSNGWAYDQMGAAILENPSVCPGTCSICASDYETCANLTEGTTTYGFNWVYRTCSEEPPNPDWDIEKTGSVVCYEEGTVNVYAEVTYIITITNTQDGGNLEYVRDEYDEQIQQSWIISTQPTASQITSEYIQWDIPEGEQTFEEGESREFRYTARIPRELFGEELENHAIGHLDTDEELHAYEDIFVTCGLPATGIFDSTASRIALGGVLLVLGFVGYRFGLLDGLVMWAVDGTGKVSDKFRFSLTEESSKKRWENRALKKISKKRKQKK